VIKRFRGATQIQTSRVCCTANPSLPDTFNRPVATSSYPVLSNGGHSENVRSLLPGPFYDCLVPVCTNPGSL